MTPRMILSESSPGTHANYTGLAVQLTNTVDFFRVGDMDIRDCINAAMGMYGDIFKMQSVTGEAVCDAADTSGNDVPIKWKVVDPEDLN